MPICILGILVSVYPPRTLIPLGFATAHYRMKGEGIKAIIILWGLRYERGGIVGIYRTSESKVEAPQDPIHFQWLESPGRPPTALGTGMDGAEGSGMKGAETLRCPPNPKNQGYRPA